jgi:hypothetical protein
MVHSFVTYYHIYSINTTRICFIGFDDLSLAVSSIDAG